MSKENLIGPESMVNRKTEITEVVETFAYETIFTIIHHDDQYLIAVGKKIVSPERFETKEAAESYIKSKPWTLIINTVMAIHDIINEQIEDLKLANKVETTK